MLSCFAEQAEQERLPSLFWNSSARGEPEPEGSSMGKIKFCRNGIGGSHNRSKKKAKARSKRAKSSENRKK